MKILQLNVDKSGPRTDLLVNEAIKEKFDIVTIQEAPDDIFTLKSTKGLKVVTSIPEPRFLAAIVIINGNIDWYKSNWCSKWYIEVCVETPEGPFNVGCWYNKKTDARLPLDDLTKRLSRKPKKLIISMDANANNEEWGFSTDAGGIRLIRILNHFKFRITNTSKEVTRVGYGNDQANLIDLIVTSHGLRKRCPKCWVDKDSEIKSDHLPIKFAINSGLNSSLSTNIVLYNKLSRNLKTNAPFKDLSDLMLGINQATKLCSVKVPMKEKKIPWSAEILELKRIATRTKRTWINNGRRLDDKQDCIDAWVTYKKRQEAFCKGNNIILEEEKLQAAWRSLKTHPISSHFRVLKNEQVIEDVKEGKIAIMDFRFQNGVRPQWVK